MKSAIRFHSQCMKNRDVFGVLRRCLTTAEVIAKEDKYSCHNYHPLPVALSKGRGVFVWDVDGNKYFDFLAGYSGANHGHCHPKLIKAMDKQMRILHHTSRAFHNDVFGEFAEEITQLFGYDKVLPMNTGVEACESAVKIARKWGYNVKNIKTGDAVVIFANGNFWGRSLAAVSASTDPTSYGGYEPLMPGFKLVPYNDLKALEEQLRDSNVCAFMVEPIQGEAGVIVPDEGYLSEVRRLCSKYNVLWIADEVQTGLGRTGKTLCVDHEGVRPDLMVLGKSLGGGLYPVSCVLANDPIMNVITPGTHGSTFGGNPLGTKIAIESLRVMQEEKLAENSLKMGEIMRDRLTKMKGDIITEVRGKGLMNAIEINPDAINVWDFSVCLKDVGLLTKMCHEKVLRLTPPLVITEREVNTAMNLIEDVLKNIQKRITKN